MITAAGVRRLALVEPEAYEADHHGFPSYRVGGKIFATLPDVQRLDVMVGENEIHAWVAEQPAATSPTGEDSGSPAYASIWTWPSPRTSPNCSTTRGPAKPPDASLDRRGSG